MEVDYTRPSCYASRDLRLTDVGGRVVDEMLA